jgi:hypothetical protein
LKNAGLYFSVDYDAVESWPGGILTPNPEGILQEIVSLARLVVVRAVWIRAV